MEQALLLDSMVPLLLHSIVSEICTLEKIQIVPFAKLQRQVHYQSSFWVVRPTHLTSALFAGLVTTFAGPTAGSLCAYADGVGTVARFSQPRSIAIDAFNALYVVDYGNQRIRKISQGS